MARKRKRNLKWQCIYPEHSEDANVTWLAGLFQELNPLHPNLTIEKFARDHGVEPHSISRFIDTEQSSNREILWHGTTADRSTFPHSGGTGMIPLANPDLCSLYPVGITDNSPVVYCWDIECVYPEQSRRDDRKYVS